MTLNLTDPVTTNGTLKLSQAEFDYLQSFLNVHDRGGYYMALYNMTGSQEALVQAEISMFSEGAGGAAYLVNHLLKENNPNIYTPEIYDVSQQVAESSLDAIALNLNDDPDNTHTGIITDNEMIKSAKDAWVRISPAMGDLFSGNLLIDQTNLTDFLASKGIYVPVVSEAFSLLVGVIATITTQGNTSVPNFLSQFTTTGSFYAVMAAIGGAPLMGKQLSDFEGVPGYTIAELPNATYKVAIDNDTNKVVGVFKNDYIPATLASIEATLARNCRNFCGWFASRVVGGCSHVLPQPKPG
jgi:hypothetical protein